MARKKVYGYWDCEYCGRKAIRGDNRECIGCGQPRSAGVKFYILDSKHPEVIKNEDLHKFSGKADWVCAFCNALNSSNNATCKGCGAGREDSEKNYFTSHKPNDVYDKKTGTWRTAAPQTAAKPRTSGGVNLKPIIIAVIIIAAITFIINLLFAKESVSLTVDELTWKTEVNIEESYESFESDWYLPSGARLAYTKEEEYTYWVSNKRTDHKPAFNIPHLIMKNTGGMINVSGVQLTPLIGDTDCDNISIGIHESDIREHTLIPLDFYDNGDGSFDWDDGDDYSWDDDDDGGYWVTEWRTRYYYYITRWRHARTLEKTGTSAQPVEYVKDLSLAYNEREGSKSSYFYVKAHSDDTEITAFTTDQSIWKRMEKGGSYKVKTGKYVDRDVISEIE